MVVVVLHLHRVNKGWQLFFVFLRVIFDEESIGDGLEAQKILLFPLVSFLGQLPLPSYALFHEWLQHMPASKGHSQVK